MPVTNPHASVATPYTWTCFTCDPNVVITAPTAAELQTLVDQHNADLHSA